jgi:hypothetical protein
MTLFKVAQEIGRRLTETYLRDADGHRPVYGGTAKFQDDRHWRDLILFYEYFHGTTAWALRPATRRDRPLWSPPLLDLSACVDAKALLVTERGRMVTAIVRERVRGELAAAS